MKLYNYVNRGVKNYMNEDHCSYTAISKNVVGRKAKSL